MRTRTIDVEINSNSLRILRYKQYDHNNILEIFVTKDKEFLDLSSYAIRAFFTLPNNTVIQKNAVFKDKKIIITIDSILLERHGRIPVEITISNGNEITTIFRMYLEVEESIDRNSAIEGNPQWDIIKDGLSVLDDKVSHTELDERISLVKKEIPTKISELINDKDYIIDIPDEYITESELNKKGYLTEAQGLKKYYEKSDVDRKIENVTTETDIKLDGYARTEELNNEVDKIKSSIPKKISELINDKKFLTEKELEDAIKDLDIDAESCAYVGDYAPEDDEMIWFSDGVKTSGEGINYDNPVIKELLECINILQKQIKELQDDVAYLKVHGGGSSPGGSDEPGEDVTTDNCLLLEDGFGLLLEDGSSFLLESA